MPLPTIYRAPTQALLLCASLLVHIPAQAQVSERQVSLPNQDYTESTQELEVKVLGGRVVINRAWSWGRWYLNDKWADLVLQPDPLGGVLAIDRAGSLYERTGNASAHHAGALYAFGSENFIARQETGWRWHDRLGNSIDYDEAGRIQSYSNPAGVTVRFEYNPQGHLSRILDHHGQPALILQSDSQGRVVQVADATAEAAGRKVQYSWSGTGAASQLAEVKDLLGQSWKYEYNASGQITKRVDPLGASIELVYMSNPPLIPDSPGFAGMGAGSSTGAPPAPATTSSTGATKVRPPQIARVASYKDEAGASTHYRIEWDRIKRHYTIHTQEPSGLQRTQVYDRDGRILSDSAGGLTTTERSVDSPTQERITDARGLVTTIQYNAARQITRTIHPDGSQETNDYDSHGRRTRHTNALGQTSTWAYDAQGNETKYVEAVGTPQQRTTLSAYDQWGQLKTRTQGAGDGKGPDAITTEYAYDNRGNLTQTTDGLGRTT